MGEVSESSESEVQVKPRMAMQFETGSAHLICKYACKGMEHRRIETDEGRRLEQRGDDGVCGLYFVHQTELSVCTLWQEGET